MKFVLAGERVCPLRNIPHTSQLMRVLRCCYLIFPPSGLNVLVALCVDWVFCTALALVVAASVAVQMEESTAMAATESASMAVMSKLGAIH